MIYVIDASQVSSGTVNASMMIMDAQERLGGEATSSEIKRMMTDAKYAPRLIQLIMSAQSMGENINVAEIATQILKN